MKSASSVSQKFAERSANAAGDYVKGAQQTTKDQSAAAIAAADIWKQAITKAGTDGSFAKGLQKSGKAGWLAGINAKGANRFAEGVSVSASKYATNSGKFDTARGAADSMPRGLKGSATNMARAQKVVTALIAAKSAN